MIQLCQVFVALPRSRLPPLVPNKWSLGSSSSWSHDRRLASRRFKKVRTAPQVFIPTNPNPGTLLPSVKVEPPGELLQAHHGIMRFMSFFGFAALQILVSASALCMPSAPKYAGAAMRRLKNTIVTLCPMTIHIHQSGRHNRHHSCKRLLQLKDQLAQPRPVLHT